MRADEVSAELVASVARWIASGEPIMVEDSWTLSRGRRETKSYRRIRNRIDRRGRQQDESESVGLEIACGFGFDGVLEPFDDRRWRRLRGLGDLARRRPTRAAAEMRRRPEKRTEDENRKGMR